MSHHEPQVPVSTAVPGAEGVVAIVVDDDAGVRASVMTLLERHAVTSMAAATCDEGMRLAAEARPELAILDYALGDRTGFEVLAFMSGLSGPPVTIILTGHSSEEVAIEALRAGAFDYVVKDPATMDVRLGAAVRRALRHIADRRRIERRQQDLEMREQQFRSLYEFAPLPTHTLDAEGRILRANLAWRELLGFTDEEVRGQPFKDFVEPSDREKCQQMLCELVQSRGRGSLELTLTARNGARRVVSVVACAVVAGGTVSVHCVLRDLTAERAAIETAAERSRELQQFLDTAQEGIWLCDVEQRTTWVNERMAQMLGYTPAEMVGRRVTEFVVPEEREDQLRRSAIRESGLAESFLRRVIAKDGTIRTFLVSVTASMDVGGKYRGSFAMLTEVTHQEELLRELQAQRARLASVLMAAPDGIGLVKDRVILEANDALCQMVGRTREELVGKSARILYPTDEDFEYVGREKYAQIAREGSGRVETRFLRADGTVRDVLLSSTYADPDDHSKGLTFVAVDITDRKRQETRLREILRQLQATFSAVPDSVLLLDSDQRIIRANQATANRLGTTVKELEGRHCFEVVHELQGPHPQCPFCLLGQSGATMECRLREPRMGGWFDISITPVMADDGTVSHYIHVARDVTPLVRHIQWLEALHELATTSFESDKDLIGFALEQCVRLTESRYGYLHFVESDEVNMELFAWNEAARKDCTAPVTRKYPLREAGVWADAVRTREPQIHNDYQELPEKHGYPEGHPHIVRHMSVPVVEEGKVVLVCGVANRQTEYEAVHAEEMQTFLQDVWNILCRHRAERELRALNAELNLRVEQRTEELRRTNVQFDLYAGAVAHQLGNRIGAMDGYVADLERFEPALDEAGRKDLHFLRYTTDRLREMLDSLTRLARQTRGELDRTPTDLSQMAIRFLQRQRAEDPTRAVEWEVADGLTAHCDGAMARHVLENLLSNAWKYTKDRSPARIEVGQTQRKGRNWFFVKDNGAGWPQSFQQHLFTPFKRYYRTDEYPGDGIGLTIVEMIILRHGGSIEAESDLDKGATFYFHFGEEEPGHGF